jgi:hypothetical protein
MGEKAHAQNLSRITKPTEGRIEPMDGLGRSWKLGLVSIMNDGRENII